MPQITKTGAHPVVGHVCATASAALAFVLIETVVGMIFYGALSAVQPESERMRQAIILGVSFFMIIGSLTFFTAAIPVLIVQKIADKFNIDSVWYYVFCGALTGLMLSPVAIAIMPSWYTAPPESPPLLKQALNFARFSVPSGIVGGFTYWAATGRFTKRRQIMDR